jgi:uncharacterized damage-inducible protein DinB
MESLQSAVQPVSKQFVLHTRLFNNVLDDIEDDQGSERLGEHVNHMQWIAGHLTNSRYGAAAMLGLHARFPYADIYIDKTNPPPYNRAIDGHIKYPSLTEIKTSWNDLAPVFIEKISGLTNDELDAESKFMVPTGKTVLDFLSFIASHESYHIGQLSIIRKYLGKDAMSYR